MGLGLNVLSISTQAFGEFLTLFDTCVYAAELGAAQSEHNPGEYCSYML